MTQRPPPAPAQQPRMYGSTDRRGDLFSGGTGDYDLEAGKFDTRGKLLVQNRRVDESSESLVRTQRTADQTEQIGREVLGVLHDDREVLERANKKVKDVNSNMKEANSVMWGITRRMITNKIILIFIILVLLASIGVIVYLKWIRKYT